MRNKIIELISYHGGIKPDRIYDDSKLEKDLGVTGDDLWELLEDMDKEFKIDWKEIDFSYFFYPECAGFIWRAMNKEKVKSIQAHPITVNHLVLVAQKGEWFAPDLSTCHCFAKKSAFQSRFHITKQLCEGQTGAGLRSFVANFSR